MNLANYLASLGTFDNVVREISKPPLCLKVQEDPNQDPDTANLFLLTYNGIASDMTDVRVQEARGIVFEKETNKIVCQALNKFFNFREKGRVAALQGQLRYFEKLDGSLIKFFNYSGRWLIGTNNSLTASPQFMAYVHDCVPDLDAFCSNLLPAVTYFFELIHPKNRIVINYGERKELVLLGARVIHNGTELDISNAKARRQLGLPDALTRPREFIFDSLEECVQAASDLSADEEGFVVLDNAYRRVKVKSPAYVACHYKATHAMKPEDLVNVVLDGEQDEFGCYAKADQQKRLVVCETNMRAVADEVLQLFLEFTVSADTKVPLKVLKAEFARFAKKWATIWFNLLVCLFDNWAESEFNEPTADNVWRWLLAGPKCRITWKKQARALTLSQEE